MRKAFVILLAMAFIATPVAGQDEARLLKADPRVPTVHESPDGWTVQSLPIEPELLAQLRRQERKVVYIAASYTSISAPDITGGIDAFDCMPLSFSSYYQGVVIFNLGSARYANVKVKATGVSKQTMSGRAYLAAGSISLISGQWNPFGNGVVYFKTTVQGAKAVTTAACAGC